MNRFNKWMAGLALAISIAICCFIGYTQKQVADYQSEQRQATAIQTDVETTMRKVGLCRWWNIVHDLKDEAFKKPENIPDAAFREKWNRICPDVLPSFIGPKSREYVEDRKRWAPEHAKYRTQQP